MKRVIKMANRTEYGFTMLEIMAVIIIIGILATVVAVNVVGRIDIARVTTTKANLKILHNAVNQFKMDTGQYPAEEEGLIALIEPPSDSDVEGWEPYLDTTEIPKDAWRNDFVYYQPDPESDRPFVIISYGADGEEGGEGHDEDLRSTDAY